MTIGLKKQKLSARQTARQQTIAGRQIITDELVDRRTGKSRQVIEKAKRQDASWLLIPFYFPDEIYSLRLPLPFKLFYIVLVPPNFYVS